MADRRVHVLLVDDEPLIRDYLKAYLSAANYDVTVACDGMEAVEALKASETPFDLVITDIKMPRMDGLTLARTIGAERPDLPVLFMSGYASSLDSFDSPVGRWAFLAKPFEPKALLQRISDLLRKDASASASGC
jgi:DNA-binding response OmpR family regulator